MQAGQLAAAATEVGGRFRNGRHASIKVKVEKVPPHLVLGELLVQNKNSQHFHLRATNVRESTVRKASALPKGALPTHENGVSVSSTVRTVSALPKGALPTRRHGASVTNTGEMISDLCIDIADAEFNDIKCARTSPAI